MLKKIKEIYKNIKNLNSSVSNYKDESIIQSLPTVAYVNKAVKLLENSCYDEAEKILKSALDISLQDNLVYKNLGKISEYRKDFITAAEYYEKSVRLNPHDKEINLRLGMCYLYSNCLDKAIDSFEKAKKITPLEPEVYTGWGMTLMRQKKYALAHEKFNEACRLNKYNFSAILLSAAMEIRLEDYASADEKLSFLVKVAPNENSFYEYSNLKFLQEKYDEAEFYALKALEQNRLMLPAYFALGDVYAARGELEKLETTFQNALNLRLENEAMHCEWGKAYLQLMEFDKAREQFNFSLEKCNIFLEPKLCLALLDAYAQDFSLLNELGERNAQETFIQSAYGLKYLYENNYRQAEEMFKKALKTDKLQIYNYYFLAKLYMAQNNDYKVREYFDKFLSYAPRYVSGLIEYSKWLIKVSDFEDAQRKLRKAQKLAPENLEILNLLFIVQYTLVKNNVCEYNIKETLLLAQKTIETGEFNYEPQRQELENMLNDITGGQNH